MDGETGVQRTCVDCGAVLVGPFGPRMTLTRTPDAEGAPDSALEAGARSWICPACGLVQWYAGEEDLDPLREAAGEVGDTLAVRPDTSYESRARMGRMLKRVRRM